MIDKHSRQRATFGSGTKRSGVIRMMALGCSVSVVVATAQESGVSADPAAASGMTTGLPGVSTQREAEMMQIRARAQAARPDAQRAAMERSAEDALARKSEDQLLDEVRETKRMKEEAARQLQHQRAANAYQGVSSREMSAWSDDSGRVKVERGVPPEVLAALPPEEEESAESAEEGGFNPLKMPKRAARGAADAAGGAAGAAMGAVRKGVSWIPGIGKKDEPETGITAQPRSQPSESYESEPREEREGMLSRIPLVGGMMNRDGEADEPAPAQAETGEPTEKKGFFRGITSNLPLVGERDEPEMALISDAPVSAPAPGTAAENVPFGPPPTVAPAPMTAGGDTESGSTAIGAADPESGGFFSRLPLVGSKKSDEVPSGSFGPTTADTMPPAPEEKSGIGSGFRNLVGKVIPGNGGRDSGGVAGGSGVIDASLFPQDGDPDEMMADTSSTKRKLFKMPELPDISIPSAQPEKPTPVTPMPKKERSPVHSGGSAIYVVQSDGAQFMRFAGGPLGSEAQSLGAGTQVRMTKVGDEWSSVQLSNGSVGIVRNKDLKPSSGGGGGFASQMPTTGALATNAVAGSARITAPVSATGAGISDVPGPPVTMPESQLAAGVPPVSVE